MLENLYTTEFALLAMFVGGAMVAFALRKFFEDRPTTLACLGLLITLLGSCVYYSVSKTRETTTSSPVEGTRLPAIMNESGERMYVTFVPTSVTKADGLVQIGWNPDLVSFGEEIPNTAKHLCGSQPFRAILEETDNYSSEYYQLAKFALTHNHYLSIGLNVQSQKEGCYMRDGKVKHAEWSSISTMILLPPAQKVPSAVDVAKALVGMK